LYIVDIYLFHGRYLPDINTAAKTALDKALKSAAQSLDMLFPLPLVKGNHTVVLWNLDDATAASGDSLLLQG